MGSLPEGSKIATGAAEVLALFKIPLGHSLVITSQGSQEEETDSQKKEPGAKRKSYYYIQFDIAIGCSY